MTEQVYHVSFPGLGDWANFTLNPVAFTIGGMEIRWYGILIAAGFLLAFLYVIRNAKRFGLNIDRLLDAVIVGLLAGIVGARLYYVIFYGGDTYWKDPIQILYINEGGLAIYGGVIGGLLGGGLVARHHKLNLPAVLDIAMIGFLIGQGIGRWGNFVNQEAFGTPTTMPWGMVSENTYGQAVHPCFLYESLWCLLGVVLLHIFSKKWQKYHGQIFLLYMVWYGAERFVVEGLRTDSLYIPGLPIRVSQVVAIVTALLGVVGLIVFRNRKSLCVEKLAFGQEAAAAGDAEGQQENPALEEGFEIPEDNAGEHRSEPDENSGQDE